MDLMSGLVGWKKALVSLQDLVKVSETQKEQMVYVKKLLTLLQKAGVILNLNKCSFYTDTINNFGHIIRPRRLEVVSHVTGAIEQ